MIFVIAVMLCGFSWGALILAFSLKALYDNGWLDYLLPTAWKKYR